MWFECTIINNNSKNIYGVPGTRVSIINALFYLILITTLKANYPHFTEKKWRLGEFKQSVQDYIAIIWQCQSMNE